MTRSVTSSCVQQNQSVRGTPQQLVQQQLVKQLQMAVQAGLINPQLLNQNLNPNTIVMLQQVSKLLIFWIFVAYCLIVTDAFSCFNCITC